MSHPTRALLAASAAALFAACSSSAEGGTGVAAVLVEPRAAALCIGDSQAFTARVLDASGDTLTGSPVRWSSSAPQSVAVDSVSGVAHALAFGTAQITASAGTLRSAGPGRLDVPADLAPQFVPDTAVLAPGDTFTLGVRLWRVSSGPVPTRPAPVIAPLDTAPASIAASGLVTAKAAGTASFSLSACGFTGHGAAKVYSPPDSATGLGYLWMSGPAELRLGVATRAFNFVRTSKKPAAQVVGSGGSQNGFVYEDTLGLTGTGAYALDSLSSTEAQSNTLACAPPRPFAIYGNAASLIAVTSMHGGAAAVTSYTQRTGYAVLSGRVVTRMQGIFGGVRNVDTLQAIFTFSAPVRDSTNACP